MKTDKIMVFGLLAIMLAVLAFGIAQTNTAHAQEVAQVRQHEIAHEQNEARAKKRAYAEHLAREAYDRAHPEVAAARKAAAEAEAERRETIAKAEAHRQEIARQEQVRRDAAAQQVADAQRALDDARRAKEDHPCDTASDIESQAVKAIDANRYQQTYDLTVSGLHYAEECNNEASKVISKGYLLSFKAMAEHHLSAGDSNTDMNQATALLVECQTMPGIYGTHTGAQCETQEEYDISDKTNWEMENN